MNAVDIAILVVLAAFLLKGLWLGLIHELCGLAGLGMGTLLAVRYHAALAELLPAWASLPQEVSRLLCFLLLFLISLISCVLVGMVLSRLVSLILLGGFNRVLGGLFGVVQGVLLLALVLYGLSMTAWMKEPARQSQLAPPFVGLGEKITRGGVRVMR